jgi:preprotein translocase subunit SecD
LRRLGGDPCRALDVSRLTRRMNRFPLWLNLIIAATLVVGLVYSVPNLFPESPAVQISASKTSVALDQALLERVQDALKRANVPYQDGFVDQNGVKLRFEDTDAQIHAMDVIQRELGAGYTVALNLLSNAPRWLTAIGAKPMYLGLDLRGGVHFLLQVDMKGAITKALDNAASSIRTTLRGESEARTSGISREGNSVALRFREASARDNAQTIIERHYPDLILRREQRADELLLVGTLRPEAEKRILDFAIQQNLTTLRNRVNELGVAEPIVQQAGADRIVVQLPGVQDTARAKDIIGRTATLEFRMVEAHMSDPRSRDYDPGKVQAALAGNVPFGTELHYSGRDDKREPLLVSKQVIITGDRLNDAAPNFDSQTGQPIVSIRLDGQGARIMTSVTREAVKRRMAVLLIEKGQTEVITAPVIQSELGASFQISGAMDTREAQDLALLLRAGALAAPMEIVEERTVGPSLGAENIERGFRAMWIGFSALSLFIILYYSVMGVVSVIALGANLMLLVALLSMLQATLTLPGIAAIALTLGMAIDANVLINERIREELRNGVTPQAAIHAGYERAWATILDSNITTLIAGIALFMFGSGPVRGFAVVHCLGILTSMFSAVLVSRAIVNLVFGRKKRLERLPIGNVDWQKSAPKPA